MDSCPPASITPGWFHSNVSNSISLFVHAPIPLFVLVFGHARVIFQRIVQHGKNPSAHSGLSWRTALADHWWWLLQSFFMFAFFQHSLFFV